MVRIDGKDHYLGRFDSPESWEKYHRFLAERASNTARPVARPSASGPVVASEVPTVAALALAYSRHCDAHYRKADGTFAAEHDHIRLAVRGTRKVHGGTSADQFGPIALKTVPSGDERRRVVPDHDQPARHPHRPDVPLGDRGRVSPRRDLPGARGRRGPQEGLDRRP